jgi:selenocysteine-specific elongation factor
MRTLGGGSVIEAIEHKIKRTKEGLREDLQDRMKAVCNPLSFIEYTIWHAPSFSATVNEIAYRVKLPLQQTQALTDQLIDQETVLKLTSDLYIHAQMYAQIADSLIRQVQQYHKANPDRPGIERDGLLGQSGFQKKVFDGLLKRLLDQDKLILRKDRLAEPAYREQFDPKTKTLLESVEAVYVDRLFCPPKTEELTAELHQNVGDVNKAIRILNEQQILICVDRDLYFHWAAIQEAKKRIIEHVRGKGQGRLESVQFKYLLDTTRKYAIPLLDYMDSISFTRRVGNTRYLK